MKRIRLDIVLGPMLAIVMGCATAQTTTAPDSPRREDSGRYWLWILQRGTAHMNNPFQTLDECRRAKVILKADPGLLCLTVSPFGTGPFYMFLREGDWFRRVPGVTAFSSLDDCYVAARPLMVRNAIVSCAPELLVEMP
jgi:hypothetical protein